MGVVVGQVGEGFGMRLDLRRDLDHRGDEPVERLLGLRLRRLDHDALP